MKIELKKNFHFLKSTLLISLVKFSSAILSYLFLILVTRKFGAEESGIFFLAFTILTFLSVVSRFGLDNTILKNVSIFFEIKENKNINYILSKIIILIIILNVIIILFLSLNVDILQLIFKKKNIEQILIIILPVALFVNLNFIFSNYFQAINKKLTSLFCLNFFSNVLIIFFLIVKKFDSIFEFSLFFLLSNIISLFISLSLFFFYKKNRIIFKIPSLKLIKDSSSYYFYILISQLNLWLGTLVVGFFETSENIAYYSAAHRSSLILILILSSINIITANKFANLISNGDRIKLSQLVYASTIISLLISFPVIILFLFFSEYIMGFFGHDFIKSAIILKIITVGQIFNILTGPVGNILSMSHYQNDLRNVGIISFIFSVLSSIILVKYYGIIGAAVSFASYLIIQNLLLAICVKKRFGIKVLAIKYF